MSNNIDESQHQFDDTDQLILPDFKNEVQWTHIRALAKLNNPKARAMVAMREAQEGLLKRLAEVTAPPTTKPAQDTRISTVDADHRAIQKGYLLPPE